MCIACVRVQWDRPNQMMVSRHSIHKAGRTDLGRQDARDGDAQQEGPARGHALFVWMDVGVGGLCYNGTGDGRRRLGLSRSGAHLEEAVGLAELGGLRDVGDVGLRERVGEGGHACVRVYGRVGVAIGE